MSAIHSSTHIHPMPHSTPPGALANAASVAGHSSRAPASYHASSLRRQPTGTSQYSASLQGPVSGQPATDQNDIDIEYELPKLVESYRESWLSSCEGAAVVTTLFAGTAAQLLGVIRSDSNISDLEPTHPRALTFLWIVSYGAIIFNSSATVTSLFLIDRLGEIPKRASHSNRPTSGRVSQDTDLLLAFGAGKSWNPMFFHWIISLIIGIWCIFLQIMTYICLRESAAVIAPMGVAILFAVIPLIYLIPLKFTQ